MYLILAKAQTALMLDRRRCHYRTLHAIWPSGVIPLPPRELSTADGYSVSTGIGTATRAER